MKVLFAGPSLAGVATPELVRRGPAAQGDVTRAVLEGAAAIGLVDGIFEYATSVWHKEILFALSEGVTVLGAASMGALRAAECSHFGMVGIGSVYEQYARGTLRDDDAVGQLHAPAELDWAPLTEALVNMIATFDELRRRVLLTEGEHEALARTARRIFFKERTFRKVVALAGLPDPARRAELTALLEGEKKDLKREDALALLRILHSLPSERGTKPEWDFAWTPMFQAIVSRMSQGSGH